MFDWLKVFPEVFKGMIEGLKELQRMAGGYIRGQIVFWSSFILGCVLILAILAWASNPIYESLSEVLSHFNISAMQIDINIPSSTLLNLALGILLSIIYLVVLVGFSAIR